MHHKPLQGEAAAQASRAHGAHSRHAPWRLRQRPLCCRGAICRAAQYGLQPIRPHPGLSRLTGDTLAAGSPLGPARQHRSSRPGCRAPRNSRLLPSRRFSAPSFTHSSSTSTTSRAAASTPDGVVAHWAGRGARRRGGAAALRALAAEGPTRDTCGCLGGMPRFAALYREKRRPPARGL